MKKITLDAQRFAEIEQRHYEGMQYSLDKLATYHRRLTLGIQAAAKTFDDMVQVLKIGGDINPPLRSHQFALVNLGEALKLIGECLIDDGENRKDYAEDMMRLVDEGEYTESGLGAKG